MVERSISKAILREAAAASERSPLFWWLLENHEELIQNTRDGRIRWVVLLPLIADAGLTNADGGAPTLNVLKKTWYKVRKVVAAKRQQAEIKKAENVEAQAREAVDIRPVIVTPPVPVPSPGQRIPYRRRTTAEKLAALDYTIKVASGHILPHPAPKKPATGRNEEQ